MTSWGWPALFLLGAYHGINPGMGWLFAVARGMQEHATKAVARALVPITLGHALSIGLVVALAGLIQIVLPLGYVRIVVAFALISLGVFRLLRRKHFAWGGMQVGFRDLTFWSFLMASAHGAGLMVLPIVLHAMPAGTRTSHGHGGRHRRLDRHRRDADPYPGLSQRYGADCVVGLSEVRTIALAEGLVQSRSGVGRGADRHRLRALSYV